MNVWKIELIGINELIWINEFKSLDKHYLTQRAGVIFKPLSTFIYRERCVQPSQSSEYPLLDSGRLQGCFWTIWRGVVHPYSVHCSIYWGSRDNWKINKQIPPKYWPNSLKQVLSSTHFWRKQNTKSRKWPPDRKQQQSYAYLYKFIKSSLGEKFSHLSWNWSHSFSRLGEGTKSQIRDIFTTFTHTFTELLGMLTLFLVAVCDSYHAAVGAGRELYNQTSN